MSISDDSNTHPVLSHDQADKLLELLINDEQFRELFSHDLPAALAHIGYHNHNQSLQCLCPAKLATPDELQTVRDELLKDLTSTADKAAMYVPFRLEAGQPLRKPDPS